jgi:formylglycine-generating enzyme required for sulfatase activity
MKKILFFGVLGMFALTTSCKREHRSETTGWKYNDAEWGGIEKQPQYEGQATGPNLVQIEGGTFVMGQTETDVSLITEMYLGE